MKGEQNQTISDMVYDVSCNIETSNKFAIFHKMNNIINNRSDFIFSKIYRDLMKVFPL